MNSIRRSGPDPPPPLRVLGRRGVWFKGGTSSHQCWTTAVERRPGGADEGMSARWIVQHEIIFGDFCST